MSASGFTPIQLYRTSTAAATPSAGNLADGELAINLTDEKLYFKNASGVVKLLASNSGSLGSVTSVAVSGGTTGLTTSGGPITGSGTITLGGTLAVANGGTGVTTSTGTGSVVRATSPTLVTPNLGTPSAATLTNATGLPLTTGVTGTLAVANGGTGVTTSTGTGSVVLSSSPTLVTPVLGAASATSIAAALGAAGTPSHTFTSDLDTGMWSPAANTVAVSTAATERMRITSAGFVGLNLTNPTELLDANGNARVRGNIGIFGAPPSDFWSTNSLNGSLFTGYGNVGSLGSFSFDITANGYRNSSGTWTTLNTNGSTSAAQIRLATADGSIIFGSEAAKATGSSFAVTERMRITSAGDVGIGTTSPGTRLDVWTPNGTATTVRWAQTGVTNYDWSIPASTDAFTLNYGGTIERMRITSAGNVGIGTSSPGYKLVVNGGDFLVSRGSGATAADAAINFGGNANNYIYSGNSSNIMAFATNGTERARITSTGNVGIGTTSPAQRIHAATTAAPTGTTQSFLRLTGDATFGADFGGGLIQGTGPIATISTVNAGTATERMRIDSSGNVGIGTSSPFGKLHLQDTVANLEMFMLGPVGGSARIRFGDTDDSNIGQIIYDNTSDSMQFHANNAERMRIDSSGDVLVGKTVADDSTIGVRLSRFGFVSASRNDNPGIVLNRTNSNGDIALFRREGSNVGSISVTTTATAYNTSSDYRLKDIDGPIQNSGAYIDALKPVQGSWKADGSRFIGLLAHEVQEVSETQIATGEKDGEEMQAMDYSAPEIIANLIAEIQSLRARVAQLEGN